MTDESTVLNNLRTAHYGDWGLDLSSQEVHELWAEIETMKKRVAELESMVDKLIEAGKQSMNFTEGFCNNADRDKPEYWHNWNAIVAEYKERER